MTELLACFRLTTDVSIRTCREEDLQDLEWFGAWTECRDLIRRVFAAQTQGEQVILVADLQGFPVGQVWIDLVKSAADATGVLWALRVLPPLQNLGIGTRLIAAAESALVARGFGVAEIGVSKDNPAARRLYERLGYSVAGDNIEEWDHATPDGQSVHTVLDEWILRKRLEPARASA